MIPFEHEARTDDVVVRVGSAFLENQSDPRIPRFTWAYRIGIENIGTFPIKLISRHWVIVDGNGHREDVKGEGVVGEQPLIGPGMNHQYMSGCPLPTSSGMMVGDYEMMDVSEKGYGRMFPVDVPAFRLESPQSLRTKR
ncbi:MAG: Co2+/Mg2+ efflux protein ApaG [Pseudomonadota bacterium]